MTEAGNPDNQKRVKSVQVELPVSFLRYGIEFVDTPGVGSAIRTNTETTYRFLPECDAVLFVTGVDTPMTSLELDLLEAVRDYVNKVFFVINKIDLISDKEKDEVYGFVSAVIKKHTSQEAAKIFTVSSRLALEGNASLNPEGYERSGLKELEVALGSFLSEEKSAAFLSGIVQKIARIIEFEEGHGAFEETALAARLQVMRDEKVKTIHQEPHAAFQSLSRARKKLELFITTGAANLRYEAPGELSGAPEIKLSEESEPAAPVIVQPITVSEEQAGADLATRSCPVCRHVAESLSDFYAHWQYQLSNDESAQEAFAAETGFCPLHTWQLLSMTSPYGASVGFSELAHHVAHELNQLQNQQNRTALWQLVQDSRNCRVCQLVSVTEKEYIVSLSDLITKQEGKLKYQQSQGACLRHLAMLLDIADPEYHEFLIGHASERFEQDAEDMRTYAIKQEALRRGLQNKNEDDAYRRTVIRIVGDRSVCVPWSKG